MDDFTVDLHNKSLPNDHEIFVARPGKQYRLYGDMLVSQTVFPELPGLELTRGVALSEQENLLKRIQRSARIRSWRNGGSKPDKRPDTNLDTYDDHKHVNQTAQFMAVLRGYFERAKKGDLVVVPPAAYSEDCLIGEFTSAPSDFGSIRIARYGSDELTTRSVKWLARVQRRKLPTTTLEAIEKPNAFFW